ncbi:MAG: PEGA domain-containing protein [Planctomycetota bacterium]
MKHLVGTAIAVAMIGWASIGAGGCASVFDAANDSKISVRSNPEGAEVLLNGESKGTTPAEFIVSDEEIYDLKVIHEGETRSIALTRSIGAKWIVLDVIFGLIPVVVDAITGNWYEVQPQEIFVDFTAPGSGEAESGQPTGNR